MKSALGENQGAIGDYNQATKINPNFAEAYFRRGEAKYEKEDYTQAIRLRPNFSVAYNHLQVAKSKLVDYQKGEEDYTED